MLSQGSVHTAQKELLHWARRTRYLGFSLRNNEGEPQCSEGLQLHSKSTMYVQCVHFLHCVYNVHCCTEVFFCTRVCTAVLQCCTGVSQCYTGVIQCCTSTFRAASGVADECILLANAYMLLRVVISAEIARAHFSVRQLQLFTRLTHGRSRAMCIQI